MDWIASDIVSATGGRLLSGAPQTAFRGIGIDSRRLAADELFIAIEGETHDGHAFVPEVVARGVRGIVVKAGHARETDVAAWDRQGVACIAVADTTRALGQIAAYHRRRMPARIIALTGSNATAVNISVQVTDASNVSGVCRS